LGVPLLQRKWFFEFLFGFEGVFRRVCGVFYEVLLNVLGVVQQFSGRFNLTQALLAWEREFKQ